MNQEIKNLALTSLPEGEHMMRSMRCKAIEWFADLLIIANRSAVHRNNELLIIGNLHILKVNSGLFMIK